MEGVLERLQRHDWGGGSQTDGASGSQSERSASCAVFS